MSTESRRTREEDFDNALPALLPAPLGEERSSCTTPRPFRGGTPFLHYSPPL